MISKEGGGEFVQKQWLEHIYKGPGAGREKYTNVQERPDELKK